MIHKSHTTKRLTALVSDGNEIYRTGLSAIFHKIPGIKGVCSAKNKSEIFTVLSNVKCHIACIDLDMPQIIPSQVISKIKKIYTETKILLLSAYFDPKLLIRLISAGANGFIIKNTSRKEMTRAVLSIMRNELFIPNTYRISFFQDMAKDHQKTNYADEIEREILFLISHELTVKQIAGVMRKSPKTIEYHSHELKKDLGVRNNVGLAAFSIKSNIHHDSFLQHKYKLH